MIKGWLSRIVTRLRNQHASECKAIDIPLGVEVSGQENSRWVVRLDTGRIDMNPKEPPAVNFLVSEQRLRILAMNARWKVWKESYEDGSVKIESADGAPLEKLKLLAAALEQAPS